MDYLDLGSSDSDSDDEAFNPSAELDSDEEERLENAKILKMLSIQTTDLKRPKSHQKIMDFETEMEAELDRRAFAIESEGGVEHQRSLSRSSSSSSLHSLKSLNQPPPPQQSSSASTTTSQPPQSSLKRPNISTIPIPKSKKNVKFASASDTCPVDSNLPSSSNPPTDDPSEQYDKIYFDSDESEGEDDSSKKYKQKKRQFLSNDDLFYDPNSDAEDQAWVDKQRRKYYRQEGIKPPPAPLAPSTSNENNNASSSSKDTMNNSMEQDEQTDPQKTKEQEAPTLPPTDAVLNCPACFTVLCLDCQRHEFYAGQFRAMFVMNCKIDRSETLTVPLKQGKFRNKKRAKKEDSESQMNSNSVLQNVSTSPGDTFLPVRCKICNSQVAVYDVEEIYHFFNCLVSHP